MLKISILLVASFVASPALASGRVTCKSTHPSESLVIQWGVTQAIGSPILGSIHVTLKDQKFVLGLEQRKTQHGTVAIPKAPVVGYWLEGSLRLLVKVTDEKLMQTLLHIDAVGEKQGLVGEAYLKLTEKQPSRKIAVRCDVE